MTFLLTEGAVTYYPQTNKKRFVNSSVCYHYYLYISYKDSAQLTNAIPTYNFSPHEVKKFIIVHF